MKYLQTKNRLTRFGFVVLSLAIIFTSSFSTVVHAVAQLEQISLSAEKYGLQISETIQTTVEGTMDDGTSADLSSASVTYLSSNSSIATVNSSGVVTGVSLGIANITATVTLNGITRDRSISIIVNSGTLFSEGFENGLLNWDINYGYPLISSTEKHSDNFSLKITTDMETITKSFDLTYNGVLQAWFYDDASSNKECVISTGVISGVLTNISSNYYVIRYGSTPTYITTTIPRSKGWHQVVYDYSGNNTVDVYIDGTSSAQITGYEDFGSISLGDYWSDHIYSKMYYDDISVYKINNLLGKVDVSSPYFNLKIGETTQLTLTGFMEDGSSTDLSGATKSYSSSNTAVASIDSSGLVTAISPGTSTITATVTLNGVTKKSTYIVKVFSTSISLTQLDLSCNTTGLKPGNTNQIIVKGVLSSGEIEDLKGFIGTTFTYSSSNTTVATVDSTGLITAIAPGIANISVNATMNGIIKSRNISIFVNKGNLFNESFEGGLSNWLISNGTPQISSLEKRSGTCSVKFIDDYVTMTKKFNRNLNDIVEGWFYDDGALKKDVVFSIGSVLAGPISSKSKSYYVVRYGTTPTYITTTIARDTGWHQVVFDFTGNNTVSIYIDGKSAAQISGYESFNSINIGDYWQNKSISNMYFDDINVYTLSDTSAKTVSTYYSQDKVTAARQNSNTYTWAISIKENAVANADKYLSLGDDELWNLVTPQSLARGYAVNQYLGCPECGTAINNYGNYPWIIDPVNEPWKLVCPNCSTKFPTNDFGAYYRSGLDEYGVFDRSNADSSLLVNTLYPNKGSTWGVDDGNGWIDSNSNKWTFIAYYNHWGLWYSTGIIQNAIQTLCDAYLYTGDTKYAHAGIILLDRIADIYPSLDVEAYAWNNGFLNSTGGTGHGKAVGSIWETFIIKDFIRAYEAFYPALATQDDANVIPFLSYKANLYKLPNSKDSISAIKRNIEDNILRIVYPVCQNAQIRGNSGMHQSALAMAAVVLDEEGTSKEWIDWVFKTGGLESTPDWHVTGGDVNNILVNQVDRDGFGNEAAPGYNQLWVNNIKQIADVLKGYYRYPQYDLYNNVKFIKLLATNYPLLMLDKYIPPIGDSGQTGKPGYVTYLEQAVDAYIELGDPIFAQYAYFLNGNIAEGLHGSIFSSNPEQIASNIQSVINQYGTLNLNTMNSTGYGFAALRDGINYIHNCGIRYGFTHINTAASSGKGCTIYSNSRTLQYNATETGDYIEFTFDLPTADQYEIDLQTFKASSYGNYNIYIDGQLLSSYDFYGVGVSSYQESIGNLQLSTGTHQIKFECIGKNTSSLGYKIGLIELALLNQQAQAEKSSALQNGNKQRGTWVYYGRNTGHGHKDTLNLELYGFGLDLSPDHGYPEYTGADPMRLEWTSNTSSHNTVIVDKKKQGDIYSGTPKHFEASDTVTFMDVDATGVYPQTSLYRRAVAMIRVDDDNSYILDIFRVKGGNEHHYIFHGPEGIVTTEGLSLVVQSTGTYAGTDVPYGVCVDDDDPSEWIYNGSGFHYLYNVQKDTNYPSDFDIDWDVTDTWEALPQSTDIHLRLHFLNGVHDLALADGKPPQNKPGNPSSLKYVLGHRSGTNLVSQFMNIFEPYKDQRFIQSIQKLAITPQDPNIPLSDACAVKVTLTNGRVDYIMNALNPDVLYKVDNRFDFKGAFGYYSEVNGQMLEAFLSDGTYLGEGGIQYNNNIYNAIAGTVTDFTHTLTTDNQITISIDQPYSNLNDLIGRYIYINNDGIRNSVYQIKEIKSINGNSVTFGIGNTSLIRGYVDANDFTQGYTYDISTGASFRIPLSEKITP